MAARVGLRDVAREAGVSVTTVSHVLNQTPSARVNPGTRQRVLQTAAQLGYRADRLARGLRTKTSGMIGLLTEEIATTPHAGRIILGAQETAKQHGLTMAIINAALGEDADDRTEDVLNLLDRRVDGIIYATVYHDLVTPPTELRRCPAILIGARDHRDLIPSVKPNEQAGAVEAMRLLLDQGHRRIAFAACENDVPATRGRFLGYRAALEAAGIDFDESLVAAGESEAWGGYGAMSQILQACPDVTAVFSYNDRMAMGVYRALAEHGLEVPGDVSVIGFDDQAPIPASLYPGLTTLALPHYDLGAWAVNALGAMIDGLAPPQSTELPCALVVRGSVAAMRPRLGP